MATATKIGDVTSGFTANVSIACASGVAQGHGIVIVAIPNSNPVTSTFLFSDTGGNATYIKDGDHQGPQYNEKMFVFSAYATNAIAAGGHIGVNISNGASENWYLIAFDLSSFAISSWLDQIAFKANAFALSQSSGTTPSTMHAANIDIAFFFGSVASTTTWPSPWTGQDIALFSATRSLSIGWRQTSAVGAQSVSVTLSGSDNTDAGIVSYKQFTPSGVFLYQGLP